MQARRTLDRVALALFLAAAFLYLAMLLRNNCWFAGGPDSAGYLTEAKMIASGRMRVEATPLRTLGLPEDFIYAVTPLGWARAQEPGFMVPTYPPGLPMHQALFAKVGGWSRAPFLVAPLLTFLSLFLIVAIGAELGLALPLGIVAAVFYAGVPVLIDHAIQPVSDTVAAFYALLTIWSALRARRHAGWAVVAGLAFGIGVWVRPTNFLIAIPLAFALRWRFSRLWIAVAAALPVGLALAWWQKTLYGSPFRTGYGSLFDVLTAMPVCGVFHVTTLAQMLTPLVVAGGALVLFDRGVEGWTRALLASWIGVLFLFYAFYGFCEGWTSGRFLLPAIPALTISFALLVGRLVRLVSAWRPAVAVGIAMIVIASIVYAQHGEQERVGALRASYDDAIFPESVQFARSHLPKDAILLAGVTSAAYYYYSGAIPIRWDQATIEGRLPILRAGAKRARLQWYALNSWADGHPEEFDAWLPARWTPVGMVRDVTLWRLEE